MGAVPAGRRRWTLLVPPTAGAALAGVLVWNLLPGSGTHASGGTGSHTTATPLAGSTASPTTAEQTATTDLLTPQGIRTAIAAIEKETGRDRFGDLTVYPGYVSAGVMVKGSNTA